MAQETEALRKKTRQVKDHILSRYLRLADKVDNEEPLASNDKQLYYDLTMKFAANVVPRSHEVAGDPDNDTPIPILTRTMNVPDNNGNGENTAASDTH